MKVTRVGVLSLAKVMGLTYAMFGFLFGFFIAALGFFGVNLEQNDSNQLTGSAMAGMGIMSVVIFPLVYGGVGFISGLGTGWLYNFVVKWSGPIEIEVE